MKELETQLSLAQKQKDEMQQALEDAKSNANANRYTPFSLCICLINI